MSDKKNIRKEYTNGEVTIVWQPGKCIHAGNCARELPAVFKPKERPWINPENASTEAIIAQVKNCPSGALTFFKNDGSKEAEPTASLPELQVVPNGPLLVKSKSMLTDAEGNTKEFPPVAICRCGASGNKPFCDGSHKRVDFKE